MPWIGSEVVGAEGQQQDHGDGDADEPKEDRTHYHFSTNDDP
jgi:hypothetical protein